MIYTRKGMEDYMVDGKSWAEFRNSGLLWFINNILHLFGWAIVVTFDSENGDIVNVYPTRVKFRGFTEDINTEGYAKVSNYLKENIDDLLDLLKEAKE